MNFDRGVLERLLALHSKWQYSPPSVAADPFPEIYVQRSRDALGVFEDLNSATSAFRLLTTLQDGTVLSGRKLPDSQFDMFRGIQSLEVMESSGITAKEIIESCAIGSLAYCQLPDLRNMNDPQCVHFRTLHHSQQEIPPSSENGIEVGPSCPSCPESLRYDHLDFLLIVYHSGYPIVSPRMTLCTRLHFYDDQNDIAWSVTRSIKDSRLLESEGFPAYLRRNSPRMSWKLGSAIPGLMHFHVCKAELVARHRGKRTYRFTVGVSVDPQGRIPAWIFNIAMKRAGELASRFSGFIVSGRAKRLVRQIRSGTAFE